MGTGAGAKPDRGRRAAWGTAALAVLVLLLLGFAFRDRFLEKWYLSELESDDWDRIPSAVRNLGELRSVAAVPRLFERIGREPEGDKPPFGMETLRVFLEALVKIHGAAVPELIKGLDDENRWVSGLSASALGQIGPPAKEAVPALLRWVKEGRFDRAVAVEALGSIGQQAGEVVPVLLEFFENAIDWERPIVAQALGKFGPQAEAAVPVLVEVLKDSDESVRAEARAALEKIRGGRP